MIRPDHCEAPGCCNLIAPGPNIGPAGYAVTGDGVHICYPCADDLCLSDMKISDRIAAYVAQDGKTVTTWTGGHLGDVTFSHPCRLSRPSWVHGREYRTIWVTDVNGRKWIGRSSPGVVVSLHALKAN